jgi:hypothetical protein
MTRPDPHRRGPSPAAAAILAMAVVGAMLLPGCAKLPLANDPPEVPSFHSTGISEPGFGVPVTVAASDPDGDRVSIQFRTILGVDVQESAWTSFVESGSTTEFYLNLAPGTYTLQARAKDELEEMSDYGAVELVVTAF